MFKLSYFFQPLNIVTLSYFLLAFVFFDILGTFTRKKILKLNNDDSYRILNWLLGFGIYIFIWFLLSLIVAPNLTNILISVGALTLIAAPSYFKDQGLLKLTKILWSYKVPILIIAPFLPSIFVKASLPPYQWDEMAYHFISPAFLHDILPIRYIGGVYSDAPNTLDLFWQIMFTVFHTYSIARLFHFLIFGTSMLFSYGLIKKNFGGLIAFFFVLFYFSISQDIVSTSTSGYIDVGAYSFLLIGLVSGVDFLIRKSFPSLVISMAFWMLSLGTKYTSSTAFIPFLIIFTWIYYWNKKKYSKIFTWKNIIALGVAAIIFGGYWYLKNFILFGNPIFPFIFPCPWGTHVVQCPEPGGFFGDWTVKITSGNLYEIFRQLFANNYALMFGIVLAPFVGFFNKNEQNKLISFSLYSMVIIELLLLKYSSGFLLRYHQHLQFFLILGAVLSISGKFKNRVMQYLTGTLVVFLLLTSTFYYAKNLIFTNGLRSLSWNQINYSIGKIDIYKWIELNFKEMNETILWCENPTENKLAPLARFDPELIWYSWEGMMRSFMTNCYYQDPPLQNVPLENVLQTARKDKMQFWISSLSKCQKDDVVKSISTQTELRRLNNIIICNSKEVKNNLYYFDYSALKDD